MSSDIAALAEAQSVLKGAFGRTNPLVTRTSARTLLRNLRKKKRAPKTSADEERKLELLNSVRTTQAAQLKVLQRTMGPKRRRAHERSMRCNTKACYAVSHYTGWPRIKRSPWSTQVLIVLRFVAFYVAFVLVNVFALNGVVSSEALQLHAYVKNIMLGTEFDQAMDIKQTVFDMGPNSMVTPWTLPVSIKPRSTFLDLDSKENAYQWMRATIRDNLVTDDGFGSFDGRNIVSFLSFRQLRVTEDHQQYSPSNEAKEWTYCDSLLGSPGDAAYAASNGPGGGPPPGGLPGGSTTGTTGTTTGGSGTTTTTGSGTTSGGGTSTMTGGSGTTGGSTTGTTTGGSTTGGSGTTGGSTTGGSGTTGGSTTGGSGTTGGTTTTGPGSGTTSGGPGGGRRRRLSHRPPLAITQKEGYLESKFSTRSVCEHKVFTRKDGEENYEGDYQVYPPSGFVTFALKVPKTDLDNLFNFMESDTTTNGTYIDWKTRAVVVKMVIISPAEDVSAVGGGAFTARDFAVYGTFVIEFTPYGAVRPTYTLRSVHLGGKDANLDWVFALCFCILALLEIVFVVQLVVCAVLQRRGAHAAFADHDKTFQAMKTMRRNLLEEKFTRRLNDASTKMTLKELEALAETVQQEELEDLNDEMEEKLQHHSEDVDEDGLDDEHARKNKSLSNWIPTIIADVVLALLLLNVLIAGARNDVVVKALELPDPNQDDEAAAYAFGAQLASYDVTWNYFTWCLTAAAFWGWLSQIAHLTVFFPAFGVPCNTLVKRGGDMIIACIMIAILVSIFTTFYNLLSQCH